MKKYIFIIACILANTNIFSQNYFFNSPEGFGANTTGGGNATPVVVSTYADLKSNMTATAAKVILVSGEITIPASQPISAVIKNKTIIGLPGAKLINETQTNPGAGIFYLKNGSTNVIIRNLIFVGPGAYDINGQDDLTADGCTNLWVDHCEFQDGQDGNYDNKGLSDNITISWCKFTYLKAPVSGGSGGTNDHRLSNLVGSDKSDAPSDGHYSITFQNCYWANGCKERMPRARNGELHLLNCYYNTSVSGSLAIGLGGGDNNTTCYVQNSNFAKIGTVYKNYNSTDGGTVAINFNSCLGNVPSNTGTVTAPSYTASVMPVSEVETRVADATCGAGATLQVTTSGVVSLSTCTNVMSVKNISYNSEIKVYPTIVKDFLNIDSQNKFRDILEIKIYAANGQTLFKLNEINGKEVAKINVEHLEKGVYFYHLKSKDAEYNGKFIKE